MAGITPVMLDDWYQVIWYKEHSFAVGDILAYAKYNFFNYNPRLGETFLLIVNGPLLVRVLLIATFELGLLWLVFAHALGRWPRLRLADLRLLAVGQALIWLAAPIAPIIYFYRPFTTNYLFSFAIQLLLFIPFRFWLRENSYAPRKWLVPALGLLGLAAGMGNEHTGPTAMLAALAVSLVAYRRRALQAWMVSATLSVWCGYLLLYFAPGQKLRYGGMANHGGRLTTLLDRGVMGTFDVVLELVKEIQPALLVTLAAAILLTQVNRRIELGRRTVAVATSFLAACGGILGTLFFSPVIGERLFFAPACLACIAFLAILETWFGAAGVQRLVTRIAVIALLYVGARSLWIYQRAHEEFADRDQRLRAPTEGPVRVPPYSSPTRSYFFLGDDFFYASLRETVAHEVYGKAGIEFDRYLANAQPSAPFEVSWELEYQPPLEAEDMVQAVGMPDYVPSYSEWSLSRIRRYLPKLRSIPGHQLHAIRARLKLDAERFGGRPVYASAWVEGKYTYIDYRVEGDKEGWPRLIYYRSTLPGTNPEFYVSACGEDRVADTKAHAKGVEVKWEPWCQGSYVIYVCGTSACWLSAQTWR